MSEKVPNLDSKGRLLNLKVAEDFFARLNSIVGTQGKIIHLKEKIRENQQLLYSLSTLQIETGKRYGYLSDHSNEPVVALCPSCQTGYT